MPEGRLLRLRDLSDASGAQTNTPELPDLLLWRHSSTSSKLVCCFLTRQTPTGVPVQLTEPSLKVQVSLSQLTFSKSSGPSSFQPGPLPSMNALGRAAGFSSGRASEGRARARQATASAPRCGNFMRDAPEKGLHHLREDIGWTV